MLSNFTYKNHHIKACLWLLLLVFALVNNALADNSVLSAGVWYKMEISSTGLYKLTYSELSSMGVDVAHIDPRNIRIYHNGGGVLPQINKAYYPDDLYEIPIFVSGEDDGVFNKNDYVLFYARGPVVWNYFSMKKAYIHQKNPYTNYTYAFLTVSDNPGRRIQYADEPSGANTVTVTDFLDYKVKDVDEININNMGYTWFFDAYDVILQRDYEFSFSNLKTSKDVTLRTSIASRNTGDAYFEIKYGGQQLYKYHFGEYSSFVYAKWDTLCNAKFKATSNTIKLTYNYGRTYVSSIGWIDYITVNAWRNLIMTNDVMAFRNPESSEEDVVYEYQISNATNAMKVWDVTNPIEPKMLNTTYASSKLSFKVHGDMNNAFVAYNGNSFNSVGTVTRIANQNLHAKKDIDYLIITHPMFQSQAERLKAIHSQLDDLVIDIVQPSYIYNEFSCGAQDIAGIRNFIKMLYKNSSEEHRLKYVLLFGDASYNYKNPQVCLIPSYESKASCEITTSIVTDDFFVCLGDDEGDMEHNTSMIDIAIGRMPVNTVGQADDAINKIVAYISKTSKSMDSWRNIVTFMCDDDVTEFINNCEVLADSINYWGGNVIPDKLYLDAYEQIATVSGQRCPAINEALNNRLERGTLVLSYNGHGGEVGLAAERILTIEDVSVWNNLPLLPLFVTATCEFSRFDDHTRTSAGEIAFTNKNGGAIAMITTSRTTSGSGPLLRRTFRDMFKMKNGEYPTMGDIFLKTKADSTKTTRVFVLFGDPALRLAYPKNNVILTKVNGRPVDIYDETCDTLRALSTVELEGEIVDNFGERITDFNGIVRVTLYDKENTYQTRGDNGVPVRTFKLRDSMLFNGRAEVESGKFTIRFILPKDINYSYGPGLISFYATNYETDANGFHKKIIVGGYDNNAIPDENGPVARIFIDDTLFVNGGMTSENPLFIALVKDENGINTTGAGIGHDITATLTGATNKTYNLNGYYDSPLHQNEYGVISYSFYGLNDGDHHLVFRIWDIYNNSTTVSLDFTVVKSKNIILANIYNAPNPMTTYTNFCFDFNQYGSFEVQINIYNIFGQLVKTIKESRTGGTVRVEPIYWDGTSDNGVELPSGVYVYNVILTNRNGVKDTGFSKLVKAR